MIPKRLRSHAKKWGNPAEDKVRRGSIHIGLGDNTKTLHGTVTSKVHIDATIYRPTVWLDDNIIIFEGDLNPTFDFHG